ncbi:MAG: hypothetical protein JXR37_18230 [Kiritimatiellae bacterium]|nr:hypothetical protein [Kiritimatiellia bacterium]
MRRATYTTAIATLAACLACLGSGLSGAALPAVPLPAGVRAVWDPAGAYRDTTPTRECICINGLWRWQPAEAGAEVVPSGNWGYFKVPGWWPTYQEHAKKDNQTLYAHPAWQKKGGGNTATAWYQREITVPASWAGRRITVRAAYVNSHAVVYVDGHKAGAVYFPGGEVDVTAACEPGRKHVLSLHLTAMPLGATMASYGDTGAPKVVKGRVARRGLCGDVYLASTPAGARVGDLKIETSVRKWEIRFGVALEGLVAGRSYRLRARLMDGGRKEAEFESGPFEAADLKGGRFTFANPWKPRKLWDLHTPGNVYVAQVSLTEADGKTLDVFQPVRFGFREFWIDGRDFRLNGTRLFCFMIGLDHALLGAAWQTYEAARESLSRAKEIGVNILFTHNYGCTPGSHGTFDEVLRAADDVGVLVVFSQPHFGHYNWKGADADAANGYARHADYYVRIAQNHPSVVMYAMSHNSTSYAGCRNPDLIDGLRDVNGKIGERTDPNAKLATRAERMVQRLDRTRPVYHHSSGNLNQAYTLNLYLNFVPIQERSDWFEHWATKGVKPLILCEYGDPWGINWSTYRGFYKGKRNFGQAKLPWEFCVAEWDAPFFGDRAYTLTETVKRNLRFEAKKWRAGELFHRWDYPTELCSYGHDNGAVWAAHVADNLRAFRTWGVSACNMWSLWLYWKLRDGVDRGRKHFETDWASLQKPGVSPDFVDSHSGACFIMSHERSDWVPTEAGKALLRNNQPLLAYIAGKPAHFTGKDHNFRAGETVRKQLIIINNSRETVSCECDWSLALPRAVAGRERVVVQTGEQARVPLDFALPAALAPGAYRLDVTVNFGNGERQQDAFNIDVLPAPAGPSRSAKTALFDPRGETGKTLAAMGVRFQSVEADADLAGYDVLIVGKRALTVSGAAPDVARVRDGLKIVVFEQESETLEKRFGFRVQEYGLRNVFMRVPNHPLLHGLRAEHLRDWRGEATLLPPRLRTYESTWDRFYAIPTVKWCDIHVTRPFRAGNYGSVASVLIEKPACGDFLSIVDGGFALQYSPLLVYSEGAGAIVFCQMDVTGRTEDDPAAARLVGNILGYVGDFAPHPRRNAVYAGGPAGLAHLEKAGVAVSAYGARPLGPGNVLVVDPGGASRLAADKARIGAWIKSGGHVLAVGLGESEANGFLPFAVRMKTAEHISASFEPANGGSLLVGVGPAETNSREPREMSLVSGGAAPVGDGVLATANGANVVFCQIAPWQYDYANAYNLKRTFRTASVLIARLLGNMGVGGATPVLARLTRGSGDDRQPWLTGLYLDKPEEMDDPYRFFGW